MRKLAIAVVLLFAGCASEGYRGKDGGYSLYRSRMMSPKGAVADEDLEWPYPHGGVTQSLFDAYDTWQP